MSNEFEFSWIDLKKAYKEFADNADSLNNGEFDNAWKCFTLVYFNMTEKMWESSAQILFNIAAKIKLDRELRR